MVLLNHALGAELILFQGRQVCVFHLFICFLILTKGTDELAVSIQEAMILGDWKPIWTAYKHNHLSNIIICQ